jgi:hypothetical protein
MTAHSLHSISAEPTCKPPSFPLLFFPRYSLGCRRVCQVELHGDKTFTLKSQKYRVSEALKTGEATVLFGTRQFTTKRALVTQVFRPPYNLVNWKSPRDVYEHDAFHTFRRNFVRRFPLQITSPILSMPSLPQIWNHHSPRPNQTPSILNRPRYLWALPSHSPSNKRHETRAFSSHGRRVSPQKMLLIKM